MGYFGHKNSTCSKPCIHTKDFFEILHNEKGEEEYGTYFNGFPEKKKNLNQGKWTILTWKWHVVITLDLL